jgi:biotin-(acetyl-CoA carboxylase) ligase
MAVDERSRPWQQAEQELALPPLYTAVRLRELGDAFAHATHIAADSGAGTLVHVGRFDVVEFALVLEPEEPLATARRAHYAGMVALSDALISAAEPETMVEIAWPDAIRVNAGMVGGGRLAWPQGVAENEVPPWLVFGAMIRLQPDSQREPGLNPGVTNLAEEGFGGLAEEGGGGLVSQRIIESFARHFMIAIDAWQENGFAAVAKTYLERLPPEKGLRRAIADNGDLLSRVMASDAVEHKVLIEALAAPSWLDPATGAPRA